jgi:uncharacterized protein (TIGR02270 family)
MMRNPGIAESWATPAGIGLTGCPVVPDILHRHAEEAIHLYTCRSALQDDPTARLRDIEGFDERIEAHVQGLALAGRSALGIAMHEAAEALRCGGFAPASVAIRLADGAAVAGIVDVMGEDEGVGAAFAWASASSLKGLVHALLGSGDPRLQRIAVAACAQHGVSPGPAADAALAHADPALRSSAVSALGHLGDRTAVNRVLRALGDRDPECRAWAAWAAAMLGSASDARMALCQACVDPAGTRATRTRARTIASLALAPSDVDALIGVLSTTPGTARAAMRCIGLAGDPERVGRLLSACADPTLARAAGHAFSLITGADLVTLHLHRPALPPYDDEAEDDAIDDDAGEQRAHASLPWPDPDRLTAWWAAHRQRFAPGRRYLLGRAPERTTCIDVLRHGTQRERAVAALWLSLQAPGTPLFNTTAPAWRQQRWLAHLH